MRYHHRFWFKSVLVHISFGSNQFWLKSVLTEVSRHVWAENTEKTCFSFQYPLKAFVWRGLGTVMYNSLWGPTALHIYVSELLKVLALGMNWFWKSWCTEAFIKINASTWNQMKMKVLNTSKIQILPLHSRLISNLHPWNISPAFAHFDIFSDKSSPRDKFNRASKCSVENFWWVFFDF